MVGSLGEGGADGFVAFVAVEEVAVDLEGDVGVFMSEDRCDGDGVDASGDEA
jgi:hypothetical protein